MRKLFNLSNVGVLLKSLSAFSLALIACLQSSVNHSLLILLELFEVLGMHLFATLIENSVNF